MWWRLSPQIKKGRGFAAGCVEGLCPQRGNDSLHFVRRWRSFKMCSLCIASLRGRRPFGPRAAVVPSAQFYRPPFGGQFLTFVSFSIPTVSVIGHLRWPPPIPLRGTSPKGKHVTGFSGRFAPLQITFACHLKGAQGLQRFPLPPSKKDRRRPVFFDAHFIGVRSCSLL